MEMNERRYKFSWDLIGDIDVGRPNLGNLTRLEIYRLLQYTFRDVTEQVVGSSTTDYIFYEAGKLAGREFYDHYLTSVDAFPDFINRLQSIMQEFRIGILRIEHIDMDKGDMILSVAEDLDCSGLPASGDEVCVYDEGFICALLERITKRGFRVREIDCWCTGDRTCRFEAKRIV